MNLKNIFSKKINSDILSLIDKKVSMFDNKLEKAICIYLLLGKYLTFDYFFFLYTDWRRRNRYYDISLDNREIMCYEFSRIYSKLLEKYGIDALIVGNSTGHYYVSFNIDNVSYNADITAHDIINSKYSMTDFMNIKANFRIKKFTAVFNYNDLDLLDKNREDLNIAIEKVYSKLGISFKRDGEVIKYIALLKQEIPENRFTTQDINIRINLLNRAISNFDNIDSFEKTLLYKFFIYNIFDDYDISKCRTNRIILKNNDNYDIYLLLSVEDASGKIYHFFELDGKFVYFEKRELLNLFKENDYKFRYGSRVSGLSFDDTNDLTYKKEEVLAKRKRRIF